MSKKYTVNLRFSILSMEVSRINDLIGHKRLAGSKQTLIHTLTVVCKLSKLPVYINFVTRNSARCRILTSTCACRWVVSSNVGLTNQLRSLGSSDHTTDVPVIYSFKNGSMATQCSHRLLND